MTNKTIKVAIIFGGKSVEHEISIISASQCMHAIDKEKYQVVPIYISKQGAWYTGEKLLHIENFRDLDQLVTDCQKIYIPFATDNIKIYQDKHTLFGCKLLNSIDVAFPVMHGTNGEDGILQGFLELINLPYVGCDVLASAITMDKITTKMLLQTLAIPTLDYVWFYAHEWINDKDKTLSKIFPKLNYPLIVKPANSGSSVGVTAVTNQQQLEDAIDLAVSLSQRILIEPQLVNLREINCAVLGDSELVEVSVCEEPLRNAEILSYQDKYLSGNKNKGSSKTLSQGMSSTKRQIPANIPETTKNQIQELAKRAFINLNCSGVARIDFLLTKDLQNIYLCELNTIPGSLAFYLWQPLGKNFTALTTRLIELALKRHRENSNLTRSYASNVLRNFSNAQKLGS